MTRVKPEHNQFDNIYEIRQTGYPNKEKLLRVMKRQRQGIDISGKGIYQIGKGLVFRDVEKFIQCTLNKSVKLPIWKIIIPRLDSKTGAIYYIVCTKEYNYIFRGTYGYSGTGPSESALIETAFEKFNLPFEVRDGDYLLQFLYDMTKET